MRKSLILLMSIIVVMTSCRVKKDDQTNTQDQQQTHVVTTTQAPSGGNDDIADGNVQMVGPPVFIYKTNGDYFNNVPVILSVEKSQVVSFPDVSDVKTTDGYSTPIVLENGYLLDRRGINENVAFVKYSYEDYANMAQTPSAEQLFEAVIDDDPLSELYFCGSMFNYENPEKELNAIIISGDMSSFKRIK